MAGLTDWLINKRIAKDTTSAGYILLAVSFVSFLSAITIFYNTFISQQTIQPGPVKKSDVLPFIMSGLPTVSQKEIDELPDFFYREDIPEYVLVKIPPEILETIPKRP